jgi:hypothetical protein
VRSSICAFVLLLCAAVPFGRAADLSILPSYNRPDPFGGIVKSDAAGAQWLHSIDLSAARGGYVSFQLAVKSDSDCARCRLSVKFSQPVDVYREWFHFIPRGKDYYPDALIPVHLPYSFQMPDPENVVKGQKVRAFWVDLWIAPGVKPGVYPGSAQLQDGNSRRTVKFKVKVVPAEIPAKDAIDVDANSYGDNWLDSQYPKTVANAGAGRQDERFRLLREYYKIFYENRTVYHVLGYGHAGGVTPGFAPELTGTGAGKHIASWTTFDRHWGSLLDGSAFAGTRRGPQPVPFMYLAINPDWPASYMWWGQPGYKAEFTNVIGEMEKHFREKGWTSTNFEMFFNQKKRYKGFPWDGDEVRFPADDQYFIAYRKLLNESLPANTPVHFVFRIDASWTAHQQIDTLRNVINFWDISGGMAVWSADKFPEMKKQGDIIWTYGGTPPLQKVSSSIASSPLSTWMLGASGFVRWLAVSPGPHPFTSLKNGGAETLVYSGERFGINGPIPSIRLKLQRNVVQDLDLLEEEAKQGSRSEVQAKVAKLFDNTTPHQWTHSPSPPPAGKPVDWSGPDIGKALKPYEAQFSTPQPDAWHRVHEFAIENSRQILSNSSRAGGGK